MRRRRAQRSGPRFLRSRQPRPDTDGLPQRAFAVTSCLRPACRNPREDDPEPGRLRDSQEDVPRHSWQMPAERHPFHPSGFRRARKRVGGLCTHLSRLELSRPAYLFITSL